FDLFRPQAHGLQEVLRRQSLTRFRNLKTLLGDAKCKSKRLVLGFEPDLGKGLSPVLQGGPLFRGGLFRKVHSAPPSFPFLPIVTPTREAEKTGAIVTGCPFIQPPTNAARP